MSVTLFNYPVYFLTEHTNETIEMILWTNLILLPNCLPID